MAAPANDDDAGRSPPRPPRGPRAGGRALTIALGTMFLLLVALLARGPRRHPRQPQPAPPVAAAAGSQAKPPAEQRLDRALAELESMPELDDERAKAVLSAIASAERSDAGMLLPDGAVPPPLPSSAPRAARFGVVVVRYRGAQLAPLDAPPRRDAYAKALALREIALKDFAGAVKLGDPGSTIDVGGVRRGDLEPAIEYLLFVLPKGEVSEVVDAPRGYWIMRRID
jgi:hypothetical protein